MKQNGKNYNYPTYRQNYGVKVKIPRTLPNIKNKNCIEHHYKAIENVQENSLTLSKIQNHLLSISHQNIQSTKSSNTHFEWIKEYRNLSRQAQTLEDQIINILSSIAMNASKTQSKNKKLNKNISDKNMGFSPTNKPSFMHNDINQNIVTTNDLLTTSNCSPKNISNLINSSIQQINFSNLAIRHETKHMETLIYQIKSCMESLQNQKISSNNGNSNKKSSNHYDNCTSYFGNRDYFYKSQKLSPHSDENLVTSTNLKLPKINRFMKDEESSNFIKKKAQDTQSKLFLVEENNEKPFMNVPLLANIVLELNEHSCKIQEELEKESIKLQQYTSTFCIHAFKKDNNEYCPMLSSISTLNQSHRIHDNKNAAIDESNCSQQGWKILPTQVITSIQKLIGLNNINGRNEGSSKIKIQNEIENDVNLQIDSKLEIEQLLENLICSYKNIESDYQQSKCNAETYFHQHIPSHIRENISNKNENSQRYGGWTKENHEIFLSGINQLNRSSFKTTSTLFVNGSDQKKLYLWNHIKSQLLPNIAKTENNPDECHEEKNQVNRITPTEVWNHWIWYDQTLYKKQKIRDAQLSLQRKRKENISKSLHEIKDLKEKILQKSEIAIANNIAKVLQSERHAQLTILREVRQGVAKAAQEREEKEKAKLEKEKASIEAHQKKCQNLTRESVNEYKQILKLRQEKQKKEEHDQKMKVVLERIKSVKMNKER